jgi:hypothetical protein
MRWRFLRNVALLSVIIQATQAAASLQLAPTPPPVPMYACNRTAGHCAVSATGTESNLTACNSACGSGPMTATSTGGTPPVDCSTEAKCKATCSEAFATCSDGVYFCSASGSKCDGQWQCPGQELFNHACNTQPKSNCTGTSTQLPQPQCDAWGDFYDALGGEGWKVCTGTKYDPCSCSTGQKGCPTSDDPCPVCNTARTKVINM